MTTIETNTSWSNVLSPNAIGGLATYTSSFRTFPEMYVYKKYENRLPYVKDMSKKQSGTLFWRHSVQSYTQIVNCTIKIKFENNHTW